MPTPAFVGTALGADVSIGAGADETGILLTDLSYDLENPQVDFLDRFGAVIGYSQPQGGARTIDLTLNRPLGLVIS
jgi:hypothetical protein